MTETDQHVWVDLTDMLSWSGHLTGTQRVVYELGKRLQKDDAHVSFFFYDPLKRSFFRTDFDFVEENVSSAMALAAASSSGVAPGSTKAKRMALRVYHRLPYTVKKLIGPEQRNAIKRLAHKARAVQKKRQDKRQSRRSATAAQAINFSANDTILLLGKPWDFPTFITDLRAQKLHSNCYIVHLIYDQIPIFLPQVFGFPLPQQYTLYMFEALSLANQLLPISRSTEKDTIRFCEEERLPAPPSTVIRLGDSFTHHATKGIDNPHGLADSPFILCVGTLELRKNHALLYTAYKEGLRRGLDLPKLVIVGGRGWYTEDIFHQFKVDPDMKDRVLVLTHTADNELAWLYEHCLFTVYPSTYEGWGLPVAESLAYGKACLSSDSSSMPEIAGDLIDYYSPFDSVGCLKLIQKYMDPATRKRKEADIAKHYRPTSWDETYAQVKKLLDAPRAPR